MNAILGFAQMLDFNPKEPLTEAQKYSVDHILKGGQHLLTLINEILDLTQIESGQFDLNPEYFLPRDIFNECLELVRGMADERKITVRGKKESDKGINVDRIRFKQIIVNLLSNAIKYNKEGGSVTFGCKDKPDGKMHIYICVRYRPWDIGGQTS